MKILTTPALFLRSVGHELRSVLDEVERHRLAAVEEEVVFAEAPGAARGLMPSSRGQRPTGNDDAVESRRGRAASLVALDDGLRVPHRDEREQ